MSYLIILLLALLLAKLICSCVGIVVGIILYHKEIREDISKFCEVAGLKEAPKA